MTIDAKVLRDTLEIALTRDDFAERFYARLFAQHPECQPLFKRNSAGAQNKMFAQKLCAIVDAIEEPERVVAEASAIAKTHAEYGVRDEMYGWVGDALVATLRDANGDDWSDEAERSWSAAYEALAAAIRAPRAG
ncbi:MAG: flavohemoprotein [Myxococcales bacterium]|nr:flavohemoprotein [Myxococcales bacterium]